MQRTQATGNRPLRESYEAGFDFPKNRAKSKDPPVREIILRKIKKTT